MTRHPVSQRPVPQTSRPPRELCLYLSSPITLYGSQSLHRAIELLRKRFPDAEILRPEKLFADRRDWLLHGAETLRRATGIVVVTEESGWIGRGVWSEVALALRLMKSVSWLPPIGRLIPWSQVTWSAPDALDWTKHVRLTAPGSPR